MSSRLISRAVYFLARITRPIRRCRRLISCLRPPLARPVLEILEDRLAPATITWNNPAGGDWDTGGNWKGGNVPGTSDNAVISIQLNSGATITHSLGNGDAVNSLTSSDPINFSAGSLSIATASTISSTLTLSGGTITGAGTLNVSGLLTWTGGTMSGAGVTNANGGMQIGPSAFNAPEVLDTRTLNNAGAATWSGGTVFQNDSSAFNIGAQGSLTIEPNTDSDPYLWGPGDSSSPSVGNAGMLTSVAGAGTNAVLAVALNNTGSGSVQVSSGQLSLEGNVTTSAGTSLSVVAGATLDFGGQSPQLGGSGANKLGAAGIAGANALGVTLTHATAMTASSTTGVTAGGTGGTGGNHGVPSTVNMVSHSSLSGAGTVAFASGSTATEAGTYNITGETLVDGGTVNFTNPVTSIGNLLVLSGGTASLSSGAAINVPTLTLSGGTLTGSDTLNVSGMTTWTAGSMNGTGATNANGGLQLGSPGGDSADVLARTLNNAGAASWYSGTITQDNGSVFHNLAGASFTTQPVPFATYNWGLGDNSTPSFSNAGTFINAGGTGTTTSLGVAFANTGSIQVPSGTLNLENGSITVNGSQMLTSAALATIALTGNLLGNTQQASLFTPQGTVLLNGQGTAKAPQQLEVMSQDLGNIAAGFNNNFAYGTLQLGNDTYVQLVNQVRNSPGTKPDALYVSTLVVPAGSTLDLNGLHVYARNDGIAGSVINGTVSLQPPGGNIAINSSNTGYINAHFPTNSWTFFAEANQSVTVVVNPGDPTTSPSPIAPTLGSTKVQVLDSKGHVVASGSNTQAGADVTLAGVALAAAGTYSVVVSGRSGSTGNYTIGAFDARTTTAVLSLNQMTTGQLYTGYQTNNWTFTAQANDQVQFSLLNVSNQAIQFTLSGPNGYTAFRSATTSSALITLPASGSYVLSVTSNDTPSGAGAYAFELAQTTQTSLTSGTTYHGKLQGSGQAELFTLNVPQAGQLLVVNLADAASADQDGLYLSFGSAPTQSAYQYRASNSSALNQQIVVPSAAAGTCYILLYGNNVPAPSSYALTATLGGVYLTGITPVRYGTSQDLQMTLAGGGFNSPDVVKLIAANGTTTYTPSSLQVASASQLTAQFVAGAVPPGTYSVEVVNGNGASATLPNAFQMVQGGQAHLVTSIIVPNPVGYHIGSTIYVNYSNTGDVAMAAPLLELTATMNGQQGALMTLDPALQSQGFVTATTPPGYSQTVQILASGVTAGVLQPGESETVPVYYAGWLYGQWDFNRPPITFSLTNFTASDSVPIDWTNLQDSLRPVGMSAASWNIIYPILTAEIGTTWGSYVSALDTTASYLGNLNQTVVHDVGKLWLYEVQKANDGADWTQIAWTQDVQAPAGNLSLAIQRTYQTTITGRNEVGPFGVGWTWTNGWGQTLTIIQPSLNYFGLAGAGAEITAADGSTSYYLLNANNAYTSLANDGSLLKQNADGTFTLSELNGTATTFSAGGSETAITDGQGDSVTAGYTGGLLTSLTSSAGGSLTLAYNNAGLIQSVTSSTGDKATYTYDATNTYLTNVTTAAGMTKYTYAPATGSATDNDLLSVQYPDGSQDLYIYGPEGQLISFLSGFTVTGQVSDTAHNPISGATVTLYLQGNPQTQFSTTTRADGSYQIPGVPSGNYDMVVLANSYQANVTTGIVVSGPAAEGAVALQASTTKVTGTVVDPTGNPIAGAKIAILDGSGRTIGSAVSAANGTFVITTASGSNLTLQVSVPGANTPTKLTINVTAGITVNLGKIDPGLLDWVSSVINSYARSPQEVQSAPPLSDPDCAAAWQALVSAINVQNGAWDTVTATEGALSDAVTASLFLFVAEFTKLSVDVAGLFAGAAAMSELEGALVASLNGGFVDLVSTVVGLISNLQSIYYAQQDPTSPSAGIDKAGAALGVAATILQNLQSIDAILVTAQQNAGFVFRAKVFVFLGIVSTLESFVSDFVNLDSDTRDSLNQLNGQAKLVDNSYQFYLSAVSHANAALQSFLDCESSNKKMQGGGGGDGGGGDGGGGDGGGGTGGGGTGGGGDGGGGDGGGGTGGGGTGGGGTGGGGTGGGGTGGGGTGGGGTGDGGGAGGGGGGPGNGGGGAGLDGGGGGSSGGTGDSTSVNSQDPNALYGPAGYGSANFVSDTTVLPYQIDFENAATATAPAQRVVVTDQLNPNLNWNTFQLTGIGFGSHFLNIPTNTQDYQTTVPITENGQTFDVDISVNLSTTTGKLSVVFQSIDPITHLPPANVLTGFLPPEDGTGRGEGFVSYLVDPKGNLSTGTHITNVAQITFDANQTIATDQKNDEDPSQGIDPSKQALVTIDSGAPTSSVAALPAKNPSQFLVSWSGHDDTGGSGVATFSVYYTDNGGSVQTFEQDTTQTSAVFTGLVGHTYAFYSVATDNVGNIQPTPTKAQASTTVTNEPPIQLVISAPSPASLAPGAKFSVTVMAEDSNGNVETNYDGPISLTLFAGPAKASLQGNASMTATAGVATFPGLSLGTAFNGYVVGADATGFVSALTNPFNVGSTAAYHLKFIMQPANVYLGAAVSVVVEVLDQNNRLATNFKGQITLSLGTNPTGAALGGTISANVSGGVATFNRVLVSRKGGYTLKASATGLTSVDSNLFEVVAAPVPSFVFLN